MKSIKGLCPEELKEQYLSYDETANEGQDIDFAAGEETDAGQNVHQNHRERLRERFMRENGFEHFTDTQILELLLFYAKPRSDTNPLAHALLDEFGSLKGVLEARPEMLQTDSILPTNSSQAH